MALQGVIERRKIGMRHHFEYGTKSIYIKPLLALPCRAVPNALTWHDCNRREIELTPL
jgi:hypothetical protein